MKTYRSCIVAVSTALVFLGLLTTGAGAMTGLTTEEVVSGLHFPLFVASPPGDHHRLFVVEQGGKIRIIKDGTLLSTDFINLSTKLLVGGERGLLGLAFHPDYENNGYFYVNYTRTPDGATMVMRYKVSDTNPDVADPNNPATIIGPIIQPFGNHNGGCIQFGPNDGKLYIGMGDGGSGGDPGCRAQKGDTLLGKMLCLNDDGSIPVDNPFVTDPNVLNEIWALGVRNPWRFCFDRKTGDCYMADVGQGAWEEINFQPGASMGKENYGWKVMEGNHNYDLTNCPNGTPGFGSTDFTYPIHEYSHNGGSRSVTGGCVYRGCAVPDLQGTYFFADYKIHKIWSFKYDGSNLTDFTDRTAELDPPGSDTIKHIASFGEDADGEVYIVEQGLQANSGVIYKIVADAPAPFEDLGFAKAGTGGIVPELDICGLMGTGQTAQLRLREAKGSSLAVLFLSLSQGALPIYGGTLVPGIPLVKTFFLFTSPDGEIIIPFPGGGGPVDIYMQYLINDPGATNNVAFSNAIKAIFQP